MGKRGPAPKPSSLRILNGNRSKRPINKNEPDFALEVEMPKEVRNDPIARAEWERRVPELINSGLLNGQYQTEFAEYCLQHSLCVKTWRKMNEIDLEAAIAKGIAKLRSNAVIARGRLASKFGFTPSDSSQISVISKQNEDDPAQKYFTSIK